MRKIFIGVGIIIACAIIAIFFLIVSSPGIADSVNSQGLSGNYIYHDVAGVSLIDKKSFKSAYGNKAIPDIVVSYNFNDSFIIALQKNYPRVVKKVDREIILSARQYYKKAIQYGTNQYWIIKVSTDSILGPYTLQEYCSVRKRLDIPKKLKLKN